MNSASFEDTVFLLNIRIRMVRDTMRLNPPSGLFMERCLGDIEFIDNVLAFLSRQVTENQEQEQEPHGAFDYAADTEWQFNQLLTEFLLESNAFSAQAFPEARNKVVSLRDGSNDRRKIFEKFSASSQTDLEEPVVSSAELSILFGGT